MNLSLFFPLKAGHRERGFALVIALMLMVLLTVIAVGLLSLASISLRSSQNDDAIASARANARLALQIAISELQKYAGPDQRITANAELTALPGAGPMPGPLNSKNMKWVGVWSTTRAVDPTRPLSATNAPDPTKPVVLGGADPNYPDKNYLSDARNTTGHNRKSLMLTWLVSGSPKTTEDPTTGTPAAPHATMVEKSAGLAGSTAPDDSSNRVSVPIVNISQANNQQGAYAYWVADESLKARIDQKASDNQPDVAAAGNGGMARLAGTEGPNLRGVKSAAAKPFGPIQDLPASDRSKLVTPDTLGAVLGGADKGQKNNFHDFTTYSECILTDARDGGLKKDMTSYINMAGITAPPRITGILETGLPDIVTGRNRGRAMLPGSLYAHYGPNFLQLRNWYNLRKKVTGNLDAGKMDPVFLPTRPSTMPYGPMPDIKSRGQAVQPYMTSCKMAFDFSIDTARGNNQAVRLHVYPRVTLWNPYNVTINASQYVVGFLKVIGGMNISGAANAEKIDGATGDFYGDAAGTMIYFTLDAGAMAPGECVVFSPATGSEATKYQSSSISANVLSGGTPSGGLSNFYFDCDYQIPSAVTPAAWQDKAYSIFTGETRQFVLKSSGAGEGDTLPIIQRLAITSSGESGGYYAGSPHGNWKGSEAMRLLKAAGAHAGAVPSRHWYTEGRLQWMDECTSEKYYGWNSEVGNFPVTKPIIANFNVRANIVHRSNFCTAYEQWYWNYGPYLESGAEQKTVNDVVFRGTFANGKSLGSPFGYPSDYSAVKSFVMFDVPQNQTPVYSLACFQHAQLSYQGWQPTYIIGNSMCEPRSGSGAEDRVPTNPYLHRDITVHQAYYELGYGASWANDPRGGISTYKNAWDIYMDIDRPVNWGQWDDLIQNTTPAAPMDELFYYDASFTTNYALWDRYFLSSLPYTSAGTVDWNDNSRTLPNTRMTLNPYSSNTTAERTALITSRTNSFDYAAYFLLNQGAFNINSTSVEAWRAFFSSMNDVNRPTRDGKAVTAAFSRLLIPNTKEPAGDHLSSGPWNSVRVLTEGEIDTLAQEIVRIVRTRGPFLGLADFVNRRLVKVKGPGDIKTDASLCGPLQAAIEAAGLNSALQNTSITSPALGGQAVTGGDAVDRDARRGGWSFDNRSLNPDFWAFAPWKTFGAPGYLTQADVLQSIGANLTARGDTFLIRGYGEARDAKDNVTAKAWCETVVQRTPDYLTARSITAPSTTGGNNPLDPPTVRSTTDYSLSINPNLAPINKTFGRRFVVKQFRWLNPSEI